MSTGPLASELPTAALVLSPEEVRELSGGYLRAADQLRALRQRGFHRAYRSQRTGRVVVERAHYDAVAAGRTGTGDHGASARPKLRPVAP
ncbi:hypothetical protein CKO44_18220 [Rubrivivax gelatinosus]|uniref:DUF4224 domain-containing protein n=1 Tax=Rubrivivax gelatinosus TaxID=28068 RepID=UPI001907D6F2|nr:DUF4224 domain-containing protein [Rubrivivax gelatinosus]MBK1615399.1 hypothetical protein [Rubrivivax gelatinosus]MBZ8143040.1 hypothetical protein [Rubrivivax gelatinosus]